MPPRKPIKKPQKSKQTQRSKPRYAFLKRELIRTMDILIDTFMELKNKAAVSLRVEIAPIDWRFQRHREIGRYLGRFIDFDRILVTHTYNEPEKAYEKIANPRILKRKAEERFFVDVIKVKQRKSDRQY